MNKELLISCKGKEIIKDLRISQFERFNKFKIKPNNSLFSVSKLIRDSLLEIKIGTLVRLSNGTVGEIVSIPKIMMSPTISIYNYGYFCYHPIYEWNYSVVFKDPKYGKMRLQTINFIKLIENKDDKAKQRQTKLRTLKNKLNQ